MAHEPARPTTARDSTPQPLAMRLLLIAVLILACVACGGATPAPGAPGDGEGPDPGDGPGTPAVEPVRDTIAYVTGNGDTIRLVNPDGSEDRPLWSAGIVDADDPHGVWSTSWNPDATELAFVATHENECSIYHSDVFVVAADASRQRRVTQAPGCEALADHPQGTVRVPVRNDGFDSFDGFLYFQGAPAVQQVSLAPGASTTVVFENVADFGAGDDGIQYGVIIHGAARAIAAASAVDVIAGGTVTTGEVGMYPPIAGWEVRDATWSVDGERLGFVLNFATLQALPARPSPLDYGEPLLAGDPTMPDSAHHLAWGPTEATADRLLYVGTEALVDTSIYLVPEGATDAGEPLVTVDWTESVLGLAWLPDGSGFVYALTEGPAFSEERSSNLFVHRFADGGSTRLTSFVGEFAGRPAVSPEGDRVVFERSVALDATGTTVADADLWMLPLDGGEPSLFVTDAYAPAWSR